MSERKKTLVILSPGFPANEADSTCIPFPQSFVKNLSRLYPSLNIIVLAFQYPFSASVYTWNGVSVHAFNGRNKGGPSRLLLWLKIWKRLGRIMKDNAVIGILNFWLGECALVGKYAARKYKVRSITWLMGQDAKKNNRYVSLIEPAADSLIAISDFIAEELYQNHKVRPANTIPPGIDTTMFSLTPEKRRIDIMGAGSLIPLKQYDQFIKIIASLAASMPGIRAMICGDGPEREKLSQLIGDLNINDCVQLAGELDHAEVLSMMQSARVFMHPSSYEGFSTVCGEALFAGAHVVSYCEPMRKNFDHFHVVQTESEMAAKVRELLTNPDLDHTPVLTYAIGESCQKVLSLYS